MILFDPQAGDKGFHTVFSSESERNIATGVRTHLLRCCSPAR